MRSEPQSGASGEEEHGGEHQSQERAKTLDELDEQEDGINIVRAPPPLSVRLAWRSRSSCGS